jgi:hypothetical protein
MLTESTPQMFLQARHELDEVARVRWSSPRTLADTLAGLPGRLKVGYAETLEDVDDGDAYLRQPIETHRYGCSCAPRVDRCPRQRDGNKGIGGQPGTECLDALPRRRMQLWWDLSTAKGQRIP